LPYFKDADEVYATLGKLFQDLAVDDELGPKFRKANTIVRYEFRTRIPPSRSGFRRTSPATSTSGSRRWSPR